MTYTVTGRGEGGGRVSVARCRTYCVIPATGVVTGTGGLRKVRPLVKRLDNVTTSERVEKSGQEAGEGGKLV